MRQPVQAEALAAMGVSLLGLNFYMPSPRYVSPDLGAELAKAWGFRDSLVGLFVNSPAEEIFAVQDKVGFGIAQLHGEEPLEMIIKVAARIPVIRAFRIKDSAALDLARQEIAEIHAHGGVLHAALIDGYSATAHGGTGASVDRQLVESAIDLHPRLMLAGGLSPANLAERLAWIRPWAIDVASGVETQPGVKDPEAVQAMLRIISERSIQCD
ncbi:MAG: phosphoribosylanthranilate isomerase [Isosphaeraceae bacterium]